CTGQERLEALGIRFNAGALCNSIPELKGHGGEDIDLGITRIAFSKRLRTEAGAPSISAMLAFVSSR
ncbi:MAG: hypothetical protein WBQ87_12830, partial [Candidatus Sulfotelmatobacter sp.]